MRPLIIRRSSLSVVKPRRMYDDDDVCNLVTKCQHDIILMLYIVVSECSHNVGCPVVFVIHKQIEVTNVSEVFFLYIMSLVFFFLFNNIKWQIICLVFNVSSNMKYKAFYQYLFLLILRYTTLSYCQNSSFHIM